LQKNATPICGNITYGLVTVRQALYKLVKSCRNKMKKVNYVEKVDETFSFLRLKERPRNWRMPSG
jgi:hypothetical protein